MNDSQKHIDELIEKLSHDKFACADEKASEVMAFVHWVLDEKNDISNQTGLIEQLKLNAEEIIRLLDESENLSDGFLLSFLIGRICFERQDYSDSYKYNQLGLDFYNRLPDEKRQANKKKAASVCYRCGTVDFYHSRYDQASDYYYAGLKLMGNQPITPNLGFLYQGLGFVYRNLGDYPKALENFQNAYEVAETINKHEIKAVVLNEIANIYMIKRQFEKSLEYHQKALEVTQEENSNVSSSFIYHDIALMYSEMNRYEDALVYFQKHYDLAKDSLTTREKSIYLMNLSGITASLEDYEKAVKYGEEALAFAQQAEGVYEQCSAYEQLSNIYIRKGEFERACDNLNNAHELSKQVFSKDKMNQIHELQVKYESEAREREAEIYRLKNVELVEANEKLQESYDKLEKAQQEIIQLERQKSVWAMAVTANHEINQPLMVIRGNMDLLRLKMDADVMPQNIEQYLGNIEKSIDRIGNILTKFKEKCPIRFTEYSSTTEMVVFDDVINEDDESDDS